MADDNTEEKQFQATPQKLKKAREKGQTAASADLVTAINFIVVCIGVYISWSSLAALAIGLFRLGVAPNREPRGVMMTRALHGMGLHLFLTLGAIIGCAGLAIILTHIVHKGGLVFSVEPIKPDFSKLSPGQGFKRVFAKMRTWTDLGIALARCLLWSIACGVLIYHYVPALINAPLCGLNCTLGIARSAMLWMATLSAIALIVIGLMDVPLQVFLFQREMRMSRTEMKQDMKETEGSPEMQRNQREMRMAAARSRGLSEATFIVIGGDLAVAVYYDAVEAPMPIIIAKGRGAAAERMIAVGKHFNILIANDLKLAVDLHRAGVLDGFVPESSFTALARIIIQLRKPRA